jgi:hypothetical protein
LILNIDNSEPIFNESTEDPFVVYLTSDKKLHISEKLWNERNWAMNILARHLLKFHEIINDSSERLPFLKYIDLNLETQAHSQEWIRIKSTYKDGILIANTKQAEIERWTSYEF